MGDHIARLHHEELDSYQAAVAFLALAASMFQNSPKGYAFLSDQLKRASLSIPLIIAEGYGRRTGKDRSRFYDIARGSAHECGAILDALRVLNLVEPERLNEGKNLLHRVVSMLVKMSG